MLPNCEIVNQKFVFPKHSDRIGTRQTFPPQRKETEREKGATGFK